MHVLGYPMKNWTQIIKDLNIVSQSLEIWIQYPRVLSIMPNRPVRDQWEFRSKMERHFPIKPGQPIGMALATVCFSSEFPN